MKLLDQSSEKQRRRRERILGLLKTRILVDGGDPLETARVKDLIGFVDGQTTNPSLIAKSPQIRKRLSLGHKLSEQEELDAYKKTVQSIAPMVGKAGVSIEVFSDLDSTAEQMIKQGREMFTWVPGAYIKYPCTPEGVKAARQSIQEKIRVNVTLCFSQEQAAAVYVATLGASSPVYVSPFVGRLDDIGQNGLDLLKNIQQMFASGDGHVQVLAASIRNVDQMLYCFHTGIDMVTAPAKVLEQWAANNFPMPGRDFSCPSAGSPIPYKDLDLTRSLEDFDVAHELTTKGLQKFVADYEAILLPAV